MRTVTLLQPPQVVFGNGCAPESVAFLTERGFRRLLLVTSSPVRPQLAFITQALEDAGCRVAVAPMVDREPTIADFEAVLKAARQEEVEAVVGVGGGSALDVAKLAAALARGTQDVRQVFGINLLRSRGLFLVCLPTTAGTGSDVSPNAILLDEGDHLKKGVVSPHLVPDASFIDPKLTVSVPPEVTAATALDALTHCIEAYANKFAHPMVDIYALEGIRLMGANLLRAVRDGTDLEARAGLALGSYYGGLCLGPVNTAAVHALAYPLSSQFGVAHGVANAVLLPAVLRFNLSQAPERYQEVALALGILRDGSPLTTAELGLERLVTLSRKCGIPQRLLDLGVPQEALPEMAQAAMQVTRLLKNNLRPVSEADALAIYRQTY